MHKMFTIIIFNIKQHGFKNNNFNDRRSPGKNSQKWNTSSGNYVKKTQSKNNQKLISTNTSDLNDKLSNQLDNHQKQ